MGTLFEGFEILCTDYDYILGKRGDSIREDIIQGNTVIFFSNLLDPRKPPGTSKKAFCYQKLF